SRPMEGGSGRRRMEVDESVSDGEQFFFAVAFHGARLGLAGPGYRLPPRHSITSRPYDSPATKIPATLTQGVVDAVQRRTPGLRALLTAPSRARPAPSGRAATSSARSTC